MNIEKLHKEIQKLMEDEMLKLKGTNKETHDILQKLATEYGDLTIPEFIDKLIQAEQNGEEILDESLNESDDINNYMTKFLKRLQKEVQKLSMDVYYKKDRYLQKGKYNYKCSSITTNGDWYDVPDGTLIMTVHAVPIGLKVLTIRCSQQSKENIKDEFGFTVVAESQIHYRLEGDVNDWFADAFSDCLVQSCENYSMKYYDSNRYSRPQAATKYYIECDSPKAFKQSSDEFIAVIKSMFSLINMRAIEQQSAARKASQDAPNEFEELAKARREARANKNAKNTTVKQALSKSSVAKKIQALQNPTPEQLAKILAAIEE